MPRRTNISAQTRLLLAALLLRPQAWRYGYELSKETGLKSGTLYPLLIRLSDQGFLESEWLPPLQAGRPPRNAYRLTAKGVAFATAQPHPGQRALEVTAPLGEPA
jgi:PadR family transcriptional regulator, regulatory protein PadR